MQKVEEKKLEKVKKKVDEKLMKLFLLLLLGK